MSKNTKFVPAVYIKEKYTVSTGFLRKCGNDGKVGVIRTPGGKRLYNLDDIEKLFGEKPAGRGCIAYARVDCEEQRDDLERQKSDLRAKYPDHRIIEDVASGFNWERKGLNEILDLCFSGNIEEVAIARKDGICRIGHGLIESMLARLNVRLVVLCDSEETANPSRELSLNIHNVVEAFLSSSGKQLQGKKNKALPRCIAKGEA